MISKKADNVNIDKRRHEIFLVALVVVLSLLVALFSWRSVTEKTDTAKLIEDLIQNVNYDEIHKDDDLVSAISKTDKPAETTNVKEDASLTEQITEQTPQEVNLTVGEEGGALPEPEVAPEELPLFDDFDEDEVIGYQELEDLPQFPGGPTAFMKWINDNLSYPESSKNKKEQGRVVVRFVVDTEGEVQNLQLTESNNTTFGNAVMNVMKKMPKWTPGTFCGKPCKALLEVPINFCLE